MTSPVADPSASFARPRIAAGALFAADNRVLIVRKSRGGSWDIPGGYVEDTESPAAACRRELREELGIDRQPQRLLVADWAPADSEGDKILYVFDCGRLGADEARISFTDGELDRWQWVPVSQLVDYVIPRLSRRLTRAHEALAAGAFQYLEHGSPVLGEVAAARPRYG